MKGAILVAPGVTRAGADHAQALWGQHARIRNHSSRRESRYVPRARLVPGCYLSGPSAFSRPANVCQAPDVKRKTGPVRALVARTSTHSDRLLVIASALVSAPGLIEDLEKGRYFTKA